MLNTFLSSSKPYSIDTPKVSSAYQTVYKKKTFVNCKHYIAKIIIWSLFYFTYKNNYKSFNLIFIIQNMQVVHKYSWTKILIKQSYILDVIFFPQYVYCNTF